MGNKGCGQNAHDVRINVYRWNMDSAVPGKAQYKVEKDFVFKHSIKYIRTQKKKKRTSTHSLG